MSMEITTVKEVYEAPKAEVSLISATDILGDSFYDDMGEWDMNNDQNMVRALFRF